VADAVVDGFVVWTTSDDDPVLDAVAATGLPAVVHAGPSKHGLPVIGIDDRAAARAIGEAAFVSASRAVVLSFPLDRARRRQLLTDPGASAMTFAVTRHRWQGFRDAWVQTGRPLADLRIAVCPGNDAKLGEAFAAELLGSGRPPDAIAAMSDELAIGALHAADRVGVAVPAAVAITGWDDDDSAAREGLTTVHQSLRDQGARCAKLALGSVPASEVGESPWRLVMRSTTRATS
jgi:DNA-binding LacI/PurR family transcriptional regulator